jgi:hypothetical protein
MSVIKTIDINIIMKQTNLDNYQFMCERNALRILLLGYHIEEPLLLMNCGLFLHDDNFLETGHFFTMFSRAMFDTRIVPILGNYKYTLGWDEIDAHLERNFPVMVNVDVYYLPYKRSTYFHNSHGSHAILLIGKAHNKYHILDWYHPDYYFGDISLCDLALARTSENEKGRMSVFTGKPINAAYQLLYMDRLPGQFDLKKCVRKTLFLSTQLMLADDGVISFMQAACKYIPAWLNIPGHIAYQNVIESFFFFDLELKMLSFYFLSMFELPMFNDLRPKELLKKVEVIRKHVGRVKTLFMFALKRNNAIEFDKWNKMMKDLIESIAQYCEEVLLTLRKNEEGGINK